MIVVVSVVSVVGLGPVIFLRRFGYRPMPVVVLIVQRAIRQIRSQLLADEVPQLAGRTLQPLEGLLGSNRLHGQNIRTEVVERALPEALAFVEGQLLRQEPLVLR